MCVRRARGRVLGNGEGTFPGQGNVSWATLRLKMLKFKHSADFRWNLILLSFVLGFQFVFHIVCVCTQGKGTFLGQWRGDVSWAREPFLGDPKTQNVEIQTYYYVWFHMKSDFVIICFEFPVCFPYCVCTQGKGTFLGQWPGGRFLGKGTFPGRP